MVNDIEYPEQEENLKLLYHNPLASAEDTAGFRQEGEAAVSFPLGRMRLESKLSPEQGQRSNFVYWCPETFPADVLVEWEFWPIREPGLAILFFAARGREGQDVLDGALAKRTGEYELYHHGDIDAFHVSYFRRMWPSERSFHTCNLRKSYGFHLVAQGADPIPGIADAAGPYRLSLRKQGGNVRFCVNRLPIFDWTDDGLSYGPLLGGGAIGFRQMAPLIAEYANLKVYALR
ncbi:protein of unknown function [Paenibacillus sp. UNCCL117]|uniref:DUF1961 family protein n=1 Tax=unclassified Paenibacillus TaxID=185978 RepID=UPI00088D0F05|nr:MULTISPECIES: DUF1961 family protein [unclassified Paenibacillus]SDC23954.1 protein of unknown function [Paenibacillus sp. cl123]SFW19420.1 protein of unknown function [Paenibacillus sp. UNCCL117]